MNKLINKCFIIVCAFLLGNQILAMNSKKRTYDSLSDSGNKQIEGWLELGSTGEILQPFREEAVLLSGCIASGNTPALNVTDKDFQERSITETSRILFLNKELRCLLCPKMTFDRWGQVARHARNDILRTRILVTIVKRF